MAEMQVVQEHQPAFRPRLAAAPLLFSLPSALRKPGHRTYTDEVTRHALTMRMRHSKQAAKARHPKSHVAGFAHRVVRIRARQNHLIKKYRRPFIERYAVLA